MSLRKLYILVISLLLLSSQFDWGSASFLEYLWPKKDVRLSEKNPEEKELPVVPFELNGPHEEFLLEASKLLNKKLTELDFCQQRVVLSLKESCNSLNDEELGKLAVKLLNCQAINEGRESYECTENMSLKQCTEDMNTEIWNTYHLITNRAKAVCFYIQQNHFRGLTEMTINKLMSASQQHLSRMEELKKIQQQVHQATLESIDEIVENNLKLLESQDDLIKLSDTNRVNIENNIREMSRQNVILKNAQNNIFNFINDLKIEIDKEISEVRKQNENIFGIYKSMLDNFIETQDVVDKISIKLNQIGYTLLDHNRKIKDKFNETMINLENMNAITSNISQILSYFDNEYKDKIKWLSEHFGAEDNIIKYIGFLIIHIICLFMGMICLIFINADMQSRLIFLLTISLNFIGVLCDFVKIDVIRLSETIIFILTFNYAVKIAKKYDLKKYFALRENPVTTVNNDNGQTINGGHTCNNNGRTINDGYSPRRSYNISERNSTTGRLTTSLSNGFDDVSVRSRSSRNERRSMTPGLFIVNDENSSSRSQSSMSTHFSQTLPSTNGNRCKALTARGTQCQLTANSSVMDRCRIHERSSNDR